ncbi:hypothetical protein SEVIR_2G280150v4 [Setaria viridis]
MMMAYGTTATGPAPTSYLLPHPVMQHQDTVVIVAYKHYQQHMERKNLRGWSRFLDASERRIIQVDWQRSDSNRTGKQLLVVSRHDASGKRDVDKPREELSVKLRLGEVKGATPWTFTREQIDVSPNIYNIYKWMRIIHAVMHAILN